MRYEVLQGHELTKENIKALRRACGTSIHHGRLDCYRGGMGGVIKVELEGNVAGERVCVDRFIPIDTILIDLDDWSDSSTLREYAESRLNCFVRLWRSEEWKTLAANLKAGDVLQAVWVRNNNSPCLNKAGMVRDELYIRVNRTSQRTGKVTESKYMIEVKVGEPNTARMVKYGSYSQEWIENEIQENRATAGKSGVTV